MSAKRYQRYKVHCPAMKVKGLKSPKTTLTVNYAGQTIGLPWKVVRPLVACAFRHVQREAFRALGQEFLRRSQNFAPVLTLNRGSRSFWGRAGGYSCIVFVGPLHEEPKESTYPKYKDMPVFWHANWQETLLGIVAHELWHRWQPGHGKKAEYMCELVEWDAIDAYRREQGYTFTPPPPKEDNEINPLFITPPPGAASDGLPVLQSVPATEQPV